MLAGSVRQDLQPMIQLVADFDGKLLPNQDRMKSERLAIVVSGLAVEKFLGIPTIPVGTEQLTGQNIFESIQEWSGVEQNLAGLFVH